jgi:hypothetical protein
MRIVHPKHLLLKEVWFSLWSRAPLGSPVTALSPVFKAKVTGIHGGGGAGPGE